MYFLIYLPLLFFTSPPQEAAKVVGVFKSHEECVMAAGNLQRPIGGIMPTGVLTCAKSVGTV